MGFGEFAYFGLHEEGDIAADFAESADEQGEVGSEFADAISLGVPGNAGRVELE
jgi:hypothetical protein